MLGRRLRSVIQCIVRNDRRGAGAQRPQWDRLSPPRRCAHHARQLAPDWRDAFPRHLAALPLFVVRQVPTWTASAGPRRPRRLCAPSARSPSPRGRPHRCTTPARRASASVRARAARVPAVLPSAANFLRVTPCESDGRGDTYGSRQNRGCWLPRSDPREVDTSPRPPPARLTADTQPPAGEVRSVPFLPRRAAWGCRASVTPLPRRPR